MNYNGEFRLNTNPDKHLLGYGLEKSQRNSLSIGLQRTVPTTDYTNTVQFYGDDSGGNLSLTASQRGQTLSKKEKVISFLIIAVPLLFAIVTTYVSVFILKRQEQYFTDQEDSPYLETLKQNMKRAPIEKIVQILHGQKCPSEYEKLDLGSWSGVNEGCICPDGNLIDIWQCYTQRKHSCQIVNEIDLLKIRVFLDSKYSLCVKRLKQFLYTSKLECPVNEGYQKVPCFQNICIKQGSQCPISEIKFIQNEEYSEQVSQSQEIRAITKTLSHEEHQQTTIIATDPVMHQLSSTNISSNVEIGSMIDFDGVQVMFLYNMQKYLTPIVDLRFSSSKTICLHSKRRPLLKSGKFYPLEKIPAMGCDAKGGDLARYSQEIIQLNQSKIYKLNSIMQVLIDIPFYVDKFFDKNDDLSLIAIRRIEINPKPECEQINADEFHRIARYADHFHDMIEFLSISMIIVNTIIILIILQILYDKWKSGNDEQINPHLYNSQPNFANFTESIHHHHHQSAQKHYKYKIFLLIYILCFTVVIGSFYSRHIYNTYCTDDGGVVDQRNNVETYLRNDCFYDEPLTHIFASTFKYLDKTILLLSRPTLALGRLSDIFVSFIVIVIILKFVYNKHLILEFF